MEIPRRAAASVALALFAIAPADRIATPPPRPGAIELPVLITDVAGLWGPDRNADHATVAVNDRGDVAVSYQTSRNGFPGTSYPLRQVELVILEAQSGGRWSVSQQELVGSIMRSPLSPALAQTVVRCERPDVVAVGERFFVTWTRRYDRSFPGQQREPSVLECAWLEWNGSKYEVLTGGQPAGQGYILDADFDTRECAGVADAVALDPGSAVAPARAAVVYAHQTDFGDDPNSVPAKDGTRLADIRVAECAISPTRVISGGAQAEPLFRDVPHDGEPQPLGGDFPALYLPDCTPSSSPTRFWMAFQEQRLPLAGAVPDGRVRLTMCASVAGAWRIIDQEVFGDPQHPAWRHRAALDSNPESAGGLDRASLAFTVLEQPNDSDIEYAGWGYDSVAGLFPVPWPPGAGFPNQPNQSDLETVPLHGGDQPLLRRCYYSHNVSVKSVNYYDVASDRVRNVAKTPRRISRPAVDLGPRPGGGQVIATTWELVPAGEQFLRILLSLEI